MLIPTALAHKLLIILVPNLLVIGGAKTRWTTTNVGKNTGIVYFQCNRCSKKAKDIYDRTGFGDQLYPFCRGRKKIKNCQYGRR
jgi:hypothetical protein